MIYLLIDNRVKFNISNLTKNEVMQLAYDLEAVGRDIRFKRYGV